MRVALLLVIAALEAFTGWRTTSEKDAITDVWKARTFVDSEHAGLGFKCDAAAPRSVYIAFNADAYLGRGIRDAFIRFDDDPAIVGRWYYTDRSAILVGRKDVIRLAARAQTSSRITFRAVTYQGRSVDAVFQSAGAAEAINEVFARCADTLRD